MYLNDTIHQKQGNRITWIIGLVILTGLIIALILL